MRASQLKCLFAAVFFVQSLAGTAILRAPLAPGFGNCTGYTASNVRKSDHGLSADLKLIGAGCAVYGKDIAVLKLVVNYDTNQRIHARITDPFDKRYEVPEFTVPRPALSKVNQKDADIAFDLVESPFSFSISRKSTGEKLFDTTGNTLVFEQQFIRIATNLGKEPNIYGLGEHTETFRLPRNFTRTLWNRDAFGVAANSNLYGAHPIYFEHRSKGTHGVFLLNSNGMDIKMERDGKTGSKLEYNIIGGILDFYFLSGPSPTKVSQQYAEIIGLPAMPAYWGLGSHQCRYGYKDWIDVAEVIANYSAARIPLETMWTDIDYMFSRWIFTLDPDRFPLEKMQRIVKYLHANNQHYILMIDPAIAYQPYPSFQRAVEAGVLLKEANGNIHKGVVWPGVTAFPDWFHPNATKYWADEFQRFFSPETGVDIDGSWIDMNEPSSFCPYPCLDPEAEAKKQNMPPKRLPVREPPRAIPGFPETYTSDHKEIKSRGSQYRFHMARTLHNSFMDPPNFGALEYRTVEKRDSAGDINYISPPYAIKNKVEYGLSDRTVHTNIVHYNGITEYDAHNLYGTSMGSATYSALLARRPTKRPFIITRSTFPGAGREVGKWLGDNLSTQEHYRNSISGILGFSAIYQIPLVGADVCGFGGNTTANLCARWTTLGAFYPFFRNHNDDTSISQEPYVWPIVASAARKAIGIRYSLLDYFYTAMWRQSSTGTPSLRPLFFFYPKDKKTWDIDLQYFYGPSILVAPVTTVNSTEVDIYLPEDIWYDYNTLQSASHGIQKLRDVAFDEIPLFVRGGSILPIRLAMEAQTTTEVRKRDFELLVVPGRDGTASGELYIDDGESLVQGSFTHVRFSYRNGKLKARGQFGYRTSVKVIAVKVLKRKSLRTKKVEIALEREFEVSV